MKKILKITNENNITLKINERNEYDQYPLTIAIFNNNNVIVELLFKYENKHNIFLILTK